MVPGEDTRQKIVGLVVAIGGAVVICMNFALFKLDMLRGVTSVLASLLGIVAVALVSAWATNNNYESSNSVTSHQFLDTPDWKENALAWHPVLMVAVFFFAQVMAILCWSIVPGNHGFAKFLHVLFHTGALLGVILGLVAIEHYKNYDFYQPSLISMHGWVGISCVSVFMFTYVFGMFMATLTQFFPTLHAKVKTYVHLRDVHARLGMVSLALSTTSVVTGIMNQLTTQGCYYVTYNPAITDSTDPNPATNWGSIPTACKIANGMGLVVVFAACFTVFSVMLRTFAREAEAEAAAAGPHGQAPVPQKEVEMSEDVGTGGEGGTAAGDAKKKGYSGVATAQEGPVVAL